MLKENFLEKHILSISTVRSRGKEEKYLFVGLKMLLKNKYPKRFKPYFLIVKAHYKAVEEM